MTSVLFTGGVLWSPADWEAPRTGQMLVVDGRIAAVDDDLEAPADVERVDLQGGSLLPAFGDGHAHPLQAGLEGRFAPVRGDSVAAILDGVMSWAADHPDAEWVYGGGFDLALIEDGVFQASWLDDILPDRPVVLRGTDYHTLWCNTEALKRSGITAQTPDPVDGDIVRTPDGTPVGTLREWGATDPVFAAMPRPSLTMQLAAIDDATTACAATGLTWVQDAWVEPAEVEAYLAAADGGVLRVAVNMALRADQAGWREQIAEFTRIRARVQAAGYPTLTAHTIKFFVDGVIESGTASMLEPYDDCPHSHGLPNWTRRELVEAVAGFSAAGFQVHLHAIGDAAIRDSLDAIEHSVDTIRAQDLRPVIAHLQVIDPADLGRLTALGVISCFQPLWAQPDPLQEVLTIPRIGPTRAALQYPIRSVVADGGLVSFGSDWPVTDLSPREGIATAVTRQTPDGEPAAGWYPAERIDLRTAVTAYTRGVAVQAFRDDAGTFAVGSVADLVWLGTDLRTADTADFRAAVVSGTWLAGRRVH
ncbi:putative amidohydrolase YtcJ [Nakamurella sp. UYEF19]|uniref:amidohydrolase n=1 Tax=Nakamurella sp. UYEF19 TaxID=1756392 RepID=UPI0033966CD8